MKVAAYLICGVAAFLVIVTFMNKEAEWSGIDEAIIKKAAIDANCPASEPFINIKGDVLLLSFLLAGSFGGFIAGYYFRALFPKREHN